MSTFIYCIIYLVEFCFFKHKTAYEMRIIDWSSDVCSSDLGPFIRAHGSGRELVTGQWALIPHFAKMAKLPYQTNNARSEELSSKASYRQSWQRGQQIGRAHV